MKRLFIPRLFSLIGTALYACVAAFAANYDVSGTLPVLYINVYDESGNPDNEIISKDLAHKDYFKGEYWLDASGCEWMLAEGDVSIGDREHPLPLQIKARGNYTRTKYAKKPFKLKLDKKQPMLGLSKSKHFAIIPHADDNLGHLRNFTGFNLGHRMELPWTPDQQPLEVVINGDYRGLYFLTESIRVEEGRLEIAELDDNATDLDKVSGGYLVEMDNYYEENQIRFEEKNRPDGKDKTIAITFDTPEEYSDIQLRFVTDQFHAINDAIGERSDAIWNYLDLDDAARYYIVKEIMADAEAYNGSTFLFRDRGENQKWHFSPLWDFGNAFNGHVDEYFSDLGYKFTNAWIPSMRLNGMFMDKVKETWKWYMSNKYDGIYEDIDIIAARLTTAVIYDYERWHDAPVPEGGNKVCDNRDILQYAETVKNRLQWKCEWLETQWGVYNDRIYSEPDRDTTPCAPLPDYMLSEVKEIPTSQSYEMYNIQGIRIHSASAGETVIVRNGNRVTKMIAP